MKPEEMNSEYWYSIVRNNWNVCLNDDYTRDYFYRDAVVAYAATV